MTLDSGYMVGVWYNNFDMKYLVFQHANKQYVVQEGDLVVLDNLSADEGQEIVFDKVLLVVDGKKVELGTPYLPFKVKTKATSVKKGRKKIGLRYEAKGGYRRRYGHRQTETTLKIEELVK